MPRLLAKLHRALAELSLAQVAPWSRYRWPWFIGAEWTKRTG